MGMENLTLICMQLTDVYCGYVTVKYICWTCTESFKLFLSQNNNHIPYNFRIWNIFINYTENWNWIWFGLKNLQVIVRKFKLSLDCYFSQIPHQSICIKSISLNSG